MTDRVGAGTHRIMNGSDTVLERRQDQIWIGVASRDVYFALIESRQHWRLVPESDIRTNLRIEHCRVVNRQRRHTAGDRSAGIGYDREVRARIGRLSIGDGECIHDRARNDILGEEPLVAQGRP